MLISRKILLLLFITVGCWAFLARADDDDDDREHHHNRRIERRSVSAPTDETYKAECGSCHMIYPPGLLPMRSWEKMMSGLKYHFGENATLDKLTSEKVLTFLTSNAADQSSMRRSQKIANSIPKSEVPLRITETQYFKRQHHEVGAEVWARKSIGSASNCTACHGRAELGTFSEDEVRIPQ